VDVNDISDFRLMITLRKHDGNAHQTILEVSKKDPLNAIEPGPGYDEKHLKRLIVWMVMEFTRVLYQGCKG